MKKTATLITLLFVVAMLGAQVPQSFNYQTILRNNLGEPLINQWLGISINIRHNAPDGAIIYNEIHEAGTNSMGLLQLAIGTGEPQIGEFYQIDWSSGTKYIEVAIDADGGTNYTATGSSQLLSVPYALHANTVGTNYNLWNLNGDDVFYTDGNVGIGTDEPTRQLTLTESFRLPKTTADNVGVVYKDDNRFFHDYGNNSFFIGKDAGNFLFTGSNNHGVGNYSLRDLVNGQNLTAVGYASTFNLLSGSNNTSIGSFSLAHLETGGHNTVAGYNAGGEIEGGSYNCIFGSEAAGHHSDSIFRNTIMGYQAGYELETGNNNVFVGYRAGNNVYSGSNNIFIGYNTLTNNQWDSYLLNIGGTIRGNLQKKGIIIADNSIDPGDHKLMLESLYGSGTGASTLYVKNIAASGLAATMESTSTDGTLLLSQKGAGYMLRCDSFLPTWQSDFTVKRDGVGVRTSYPQTYFHIYGTKDASLTSPTSGNFISGSTSGTNIVMDDNEIMARNNGNTSPLYLQQDGGDVLINGNIVRLVNNEHKASVSNMDIGLDAILQLSPECYSTIDTKMHDYGLNVKQLEQHIPEAIVYGDAENNLPGINYNTVLMAMLNAIKDLKQENDVLKDQIKTLDNKLEIVLEQIEGLK